MGLFGSIAKAVGGAFKVAGKVAGVASAVAPIPGLGFAGKLAGGFGGILGKAQKLKTAGGKVLGPGTIAALSSVMPGGSIANQSFYGSGYAGSGAGPGGTATTKKTRPRWKTRKKKAGSMETYYRRGRRIKRRRGGSRRRLSRAQLRAGFGGRRRMRA